MVPPAPTATTFRGTSVQIPKRHQRQEKIKLTHSYKLQMNSFKEKSAMLQPTYKSHLVEKAENVLKRQKERDRREIESKLSQGPARTFAIQSDRDIVTAEIGVRFRGRSPSDNESKVAPWGYETGMTNKKKSVRIHGGRGETSSMRASPGINSALETDKVLGNVYKPSALDTSEPPQCRP